MFKKRNLLVRSGFCALLLAVTTASPQTAIAQPTPGLPGAAAITAAARTDSPADMNLALVQAIAANPRRVDDLVAFATAQAPGHRDSMVSAAAAAFPAPVRPFHRQALQPHPHGHRVPTTRERHHLGDAQVAVWASEIKVRCG